ncbi:MAG TPA: hypothetical protein VK914_06040 [bacterium]|jgi:hypothetical protein|nr:hypothetical protein [bacterium]
MKHSWQIWVVLGLMVLSFLASIPGVIQPDPLEVQVFDWWGRGSWVLLFNGISSLAILLALVAFFVRKPWSLSLVLSGIWVPKVFSAIYMGIILNNLGDFEALMPKPALNSAAGIKLIQAHVEQIIFTWGFYAALAAIFAWGSILTALVWWKRTELQGYE